MHWPVFWQSTWIDTETKLHVSYVFLSYLEIILLPKNNSESRNVECVLRDYYTELLDLNSRVTRIGLACYDSFRPTPVFLLYNLNGPGGLEPLEVSLSFYCNQNEAVESM